MSPKKKSLSIPKSAEQYDRLVASGERHYKKGQFHDALNHFRTALDYDGHHPNLLVLMARCLFGLGMKNKAIQMMEHALDQNADNPAVCESLGNACIAMDLNELAIKFFTINVQLNPSEPIAYNNLATALRENGQLDESIQLLQDVIPIYPENAFLWNSIGAGVSFRDGYVSAQPFYEEAYRLDPSVSIFSSNLCLVYSNLGRYDEAWKFARKTVNLAPTNATFQLALAHRSFTIGKFPEAFKALEWHNHPTAPGSVFMPYNIDPWKGEDLTGKTILIGAEQGIGDEVFFASLYPKLIEEAGHVIIGCDERLVPLFQNSFREATILPYMSGQHDAGYKVRLYEGIDPEKIDYMCLYTDVMRYKWRSRDDIPDMTRGFLTPAGDKTRRWKEKISALPHDLNIGICWRSGLKQAKRQMFYADLMEWIPVLKTKNVNFINVQYGECRDDLKEVFDSHGIQIHHFEELNLKDDFEETAALMQNLDLVIGPGTSPLAQAAAGGTPAWWLMYNARPWWTFGLEKNTPLFPEYPLSVKPASLTWSQYMPVFAQEEFAPWVENKLKEKSA